jgi:pyruvate,water dikinase
LRELAELRADDADAFGGKSASLGELVGAGANVPPGVALSTEAFDRYLATDGLDERISEALENLATADIAAVQRAAESIAATMRAAAVPDEIRSAIERSYRALATYAESAEPAVAVRSSARGEDSDAATFAGQQETFLWVSGLDAICNAIRECWISLFSPTAISYRAQMAAGEDAPAMGVTVQLMVDAAVSGVMFTCSPTTGDPSIVSINASWGLGLGVVGGEVTPDEFSISKVTGEVLRQTIGDKAIEYLRDPAGGGARRTDTPHERRHAASLDSERLLELLDVGKRIERHFGSRQDIEWAIARTGEFPASLYMLQARPVTATSGATASGDRRGAGAMAHVLGTFGVKPPA